MTGIRLSRTRARRWGILAVCLMLTLSVLAAFPASAHESPNHGTIKVHDDEEADPPRRNQPHVSCEFWIEGFDMSDAPGHLRIYSIPPTTSERELVLNETWEADSGSVEEGFHFNAGPFELDPGHYRVEVYVDSGHPGSTEHFAKAKTFWVNPCPAEGEEPVFAPCPGNVRAMPQDDMTIDLAWDPIANATQYRIYRQVIGEDEDLTSYAWVDGNTTSFTDEDTEAGKTYLYAVTSVVGNQEARVHDPACQVQVTAIPVFPTLVAAGAAIAGSLLAYAHLRPRRNG